MDILIIGNGFDLAHGLKTSYGQFLDFCKNLNVKDEKYLNYKRCLERNLWMKHFIARQNQLGGTWIDLETEIYDVIKFLNKQFTFDKSESSRYRINKVLTIEIFDQKFQLQNIDNFLRDFHFNEKLSKDGIETPFQKYLFNYHIENSIDIINLLHKHLIEFTQLFEKYILEEVFANQEQIKKYNFLFQSKDRAVHVLSFNYTDTYERLYKEKSLYADPKSLYVYIHGKAGQKNLIFGTKSFYNYLPNSNNEKIPVAFNIFKKHNMRHKYNTIEAYQNLLKTITDPRRTIKPVFHIIGHSLDITDRVILEHILLANKNAVIKIYYHDEESQEKLLNNITDIIGEKEVMTRVQLIDQHDEKRGILRPVKKEVLTSS